MTPETVIAANGLLAKAKPQNRSLWIITTEIVEFEWLNRCEGVEKETQKNIETTDRQHATIYRVITELQAHITVPYPAASAISLSHLQVPSRLRELAQDMIAHSSILAENDDAIKRARRRVVDGKAPAKLGSNDSFRDCEIVETYIGLAAELGNQGFDRKMYFITSNKKDFCAELNGSPHHALKMDFDKVGLSLFTSFPAVYYDI